MNRRASLGCLAGAVSLGALPIRARAKGANEFLICTQTIFAPLVNQIGEAYQKANSDLVVGVREDSFETNLRYLDGGSGDVAVLDRAPGESTYVDHPLAVVPYAVIAGAGSGVSSLSTAQVAGIFAGRFTSWSQVGGPDVPIVPIERPRGSGTTALFASLFGPPGAQGVVVDNTSSAVITAVRNERGAIGYVGLPYATPEGVRVLAIDGALPSAEAIAAGAYKFYTIVHAATLGQPSPRISRFLSFAESRRELIHAAGFYTIFETKRQGR